MSPRWSGAVLVLFVAPICVDVAEGHFLALTRSHFWPSADAADAKQTGVQFVDASLYAETDQVEKKDSKNPPPKYPFIASLHRHLEEVFAKKAEHWWSDWKLWVGLSFWFAVWARWLIHGYDEIYYQRALFAFGINIVILHHLQYAASIKIGMLGICALLSAQSMFQSLMWARNEEYKKVEDKFLCDTMYLDLSLPVEQILVLFVAQLIVWWFYMTSILGNFDFDHVNYMFWLVAYLAMQMTMIFNRGDDSVLGNAFPVHDVCALFLNCDHITITLEDSDQKPFKLSKANIIMRGVMGFFVNAILREIMAYTIPLMLMGFAEPMDFVVYCVGVNFICTLDDMKEKTFDLLEDGKLEAEEAPPVQ